jgi:hypothetical protein
MGLWLFTVALLKTDAPNADSNLNMAPGWEAVSYAWMRILRDVQQG